MKNPILDLTEHVNRDDIRTVVDSLGYGTMLQSNPRELAIASSDQAIDYWHPRTKQELQKAGMIVACSTSSYTKKANCHDHAQPLPRPSQYSNPSPATPKLIAAP